MKKLSLVLLLVFTLTLQGCAYDVGYVLGSATRYAGAAAAAEAL